MNLKNQIKNCLTQDTSLTHLKGEKWKDIPDFEGIYEISNYGRVKSVGRLIDGGKFDYFRPERIIKLRLTSNIHKKKKNGKSYPDVQMKLHKDKKRYYFSVARIVYHLFVSPFDLKDYSVIITRKNGNNLDCSVKNLMLISISDMAKKGFANGTRKSQFQLQVKSVTQYSPTGNKIKEYKTIQEATKETNVAENYISGAAISKYRMAGGYYWRYDAPKTAIKIPKNKQQREIEMISGDTNHHRLNRSLKNLPGEKWKPVKDFEGLYEVSQYGRLKSLRRLKELTTKKNNDIQFWTKEFIMKQTIVEISNINKHADSLKYLKVSLKKENIYTPHIISRLVYNTFGTGKIADHDIKIVHKDGDNFNNHIENLEPQTQGEIIRKSYESGNRSSHFTNLSKNLRSKYREQAAIKNRKSITQYSLAGKRIKFFDSTVAAAKETGINETGISNALNGRYLTAGGFIWRKGKGENLLTR